MRCSVLWYNLLLVFFTVPAYVVAKIGVLFARCKPFGAQSTRRSLVFILTSLAWRSAMACACWIKVNVAGLSEFRSQMGASGRPVVIVANHTSFLDTILLVGFVPIRNIRKAKMLVSAHLFKIPALRTIVTAMGHLAVPFKATADLDSFELDKELMAIRQQELEDHVRAGGVAGWFPEGRMNPGNNAEVGVFRAGGFTLATRVDVEIWCVAFRGNAVCWPRTSAVGGYPARIGVEITRLCASSYDFVAASKQTFKDERDKTIYLANSAHDVIQASIDNLYAANGCGPEANLLKK